MTILLLLYQTSSSQRTFTTIAEEALLCLFEIRRILPYVMTQCYQSHLQEIVLQVNSINRFVPYILHLQGTCAPFSPLLDET